MFVEAPADEAEGAEAMAAAFSLTLAETRLVEHLLAGRNLKRVGRSARRRDDDR